MKRIPIDECPAGLAIDAAVAEVYTGPGIKLRVVLETFCPSTDIAAAWELVEHWMAENKENTFDIVSNQEPKLRWLAFFESDKSMIADTAPLAITRAYLKAKGVEFIEVPDNETDNR